MRLTWIRSGLVACVGLLATGCGNEGAQREVTPPAPPPAEGGGSRGELSARLRAALDAGDLEAGVKAWEALAANFEGVGETATGHTLLRPAVVGAVFDAAVAQARRAIEGPAPQPDRAEAALAVARSLASQVDDTESPLTLAAATAWVGLTRVGDLGVSLAEHDGPRVLAVLDDFDLGETSLTFPLGRWQREGAAAGLRVGVLPMLSGQVRVGIRRVPAKDADEERRSMANRVAGLGLALEPEPPDMDAARAQLGLLGQDAALLVFDRAGRLVARLSGRGIEPRALDVVVQRVGSR